MQWNLYNGIEIFCNNYLLHQVSVLQLILCREISIRDGSATVKA